MAFLRDSISSRTIGCFGMPPVPGEKQIQGFSYGRRPNNRARVETLKKPPIQGGRKNPGRILNIFFFRKWRLCPQVAKSVCEARLPGTSSYNKPSSPNTLVKLDYTVRNIAGAKVVSETRPLGIAKCSASAKNKACRVYRQRKHNQHCRTAFGKAVGKAQHFGTPRTMLRQSEFAVFPDEAGFSRAEQLARPA